MCAWVLVEGGADHAEDIYWYNNNTAIRLKLEDGGLYDMELLECDLTVSLIPRPSNSRCESDNESVEKTIDKNRRELWRTAWDSRLRATCFPILKELGRLLREYGLVAPAAGR